MVNTDKDQEVLFDNSIVWQQLFFLDEVEVTYGCNITRPDLIELIRLTHIKDLIKSDKFRDRISTIRGTYYSYKEASRENAHIWVPGQAEKLKEKYNALKRNLPWFCMANYKSKRSTDSLLSITGCIIDIDHVDVPERLQELIYKILANIMSTLVQFVVWELVKNIHSFIDIPYLNKNVEQVLICLVVFMLIGLIRSCLIKHLEKKTD